MVSFLKSLIDGIKKKESRTLGNGNELYYTRTGFGIKVTPKNKLKTMRSFAIRDQIKRKPEIMKQPGFDTYNKD